MHTTTPPRPRLGSLFTGIGGLDLAIEEYYGAEAAWHCQYEPPDKHGRPDTHQYAARVLAQHWPGVPNLGDITQVNWDQVEPVDILAGGFPCTDLSLAGARAGLNPGTRSGLWAHMARAIEALRPRLVVIENVRGLLSAPAHTHGDLEPCTWCMGDTEGEPVLRALGAVLGDLAGLGFDAEWVGLPASAIGAPHERWREFVLAWPAAEGPDLAARGQRRITAPGQAESGRPRADARGRGGVPAAHTQGERHRHPGPQGLGGLPAPAVAGRSAAPANTDRRRFPEHGELPSGRDTVCGRVRADADRRDQAPAEPACPTCGCGEWTHDDGGFCAGLCGGTCADPELGRPGEAPTDAPGDGRGEGRPEPARLGGRPDTPAGGAPDWGPYEPAIRRWELVLDRPAPRPVDDRGRLSPDLPEWMMGYPAGWTVLDEPPAGMSDSQIRNARLKACGNGVVPQQALAALQLLHRAAMFDALATAA